MSIPHLKWPLTLLFTLCATTAVAAPPASLELASIETGLAQPVVARHAGDGSGRLFIVEQSGRIKILDANDDLLATPFLNLASQIDDAGGEQGLLGLTFDPDYSSNGYFYVNYTYDPAGQGKDRTRVSRFQVSDGDVNIANANSEDIIIEIEQDFGNHNGGDIHFGPDGYLYIGMGDGGGSDDGLNRAQTLSATGSASLLGKMLRLDVHGTATEPAGVEKCGEVQNGEMQNYKIPFDTSNGKIANPWLGDDNVCDEIWTYGWRNPWRWSFDRLTGDMFIGDVGQYYVEEVSWQASDSTGGGNYGWNCREGSSEYVGDCEFPEDLIDPILEYQHAGINACSITGGYVYRGSIAELQGDYVYADYCNGYIWFASKNAGEWSATLWQDTTLRPSAFGEDESGELYLVDRGSSSSSTGTIYRFVDPVRNQVFNNGFEEIE